jgi:hypothetical protein
MLPKKKKKSAAASWGFKACRPYSTILLTYDVNPPSASSLGVLCQLQMNPFQTSFLMKFTENLFSTFMKASGLVNDF